MALLKVMRFSFFLITLFILSFPSIAQQFEEISLTEFESNIVNLGKEAVKEFETSKKVALTSGKNSRIDFWSVDGVAMGSVKIFQAGKVGTLTVGLIIADTGQRLKSKYRLKRANLFSKWKIVQ